MCGAHRQTRITGIHPALYRTQARCPAALQTPGSRVRGVLVNSPTILAGRHQQVAALGAAEHLAAARVVPGGGEGAQAVGVVVPGPGRGDGHGGAGGGGEASHREVGVQMPGGVPSSVLPASLGDTAAGAGVPQAELWPAQHLAHPPAVPVAAVEEHGPLGVEAVQLPVAGQAAPRPRPPEHPAPAALVLGRGTPGGESQHLPPGDRVLGLVTRTTLPHGLRDVLGEDAPGEGVRGEGQPAGGAAADLRPRPAAAAEGVATAALEDPSRRPHLLQTHGALQQSVHFEYLV